MLILKLSLKIPRLQVDYNKAIKKSLKSVFFLTLWKQITELDFVSNFDCTRQNRFRSLETSNQETKLSKEETFQFQLVEAKKRKFQDNQINSILNKLKNL